MYVSVADVAVELGRALPEGSDEARQVAWWIARVEGRILARVPDLTQRVAASTGYLATLVGVVVDVVARRVRNPDGFRSERVDDYYYDRESGAGSSDLWLTDAEWAELLPVTPTGAFSTRPRFEPDCIG